MATLDRTKTYLTLIDLPEFRNVCNNLAKQIDKQDLCDDPLVHYGRPFETSSHITVLFGMPRLPSDEWRKKTVDEPIVLTMDNIGSFETRDKEFKEGGKHSYDVLWLGLTGRESLNELREGLIKNTNTVPDHSLTPHVTIAYLKPGTAQKYIDLFGPQIKNSPTTHVVEELQVRAYQQSRVLMHIHLVPWKTKILETLETKSTGSPSTAPQKQEPSTQETAVETNGSFKREKKEEEGGEETDASPTKKPKHQLASDE